MKDVLKLTQFETHKENPFLIQALEQVNNKTKKKRKYFSASKSMCEVVNSDGEIEGYQAFFKQIEVDEEQFTKLYTSQLKSLFQLGNGAIRVFAYIQTKVKPNSDTFLFDLEKCGEYTSLSVSTIYKGLAELVKNEFIARSKYDFLYYINPLIFFNGDRIVFAKAIQKKRKISETDKNQLAIDFQHSGEQNPIIEYGNFDL